MSSVLNLEGGVRILVVKPYDLEGHYVTPEGVHLSNYNCRFYTSNLSDYQLTRMFHGDVTVCVCGDDIVVAPALFHGRKGKRKSTLSVT